MLLAGLDPVSLISTTPNKRDAVRNPITWSHSVSSVETVIEIGTSGAERMSCSWSCRVSPSLIYGHAAESACGIYSRIKLPAVHRKTRPEIRKNSDLVVSPYPSCYEVWFIARWQFCCTGIHRFCCTGIHRWNYWDCRYR